jgi:probable rRNA maturation factor
MIKVRFGYADVPAIAMKDKTKVKAFVQEIFTLEGKELDGLQYVFCSDDYLLEINKSFLQHDYYTDIITFDLSEGAGSVIGEVYVSIDRVKENASTHSQPFSRELLRVVFHGALHLCGYRDKKKSEITIMREKEEYYLRLFEQN